jgi:glycosyltransferase involved in cell wall biosynthesis
MEDIHLAIIGSGPLSSNLKSFVKKEQIDNVSFLGYKKNVNDFYNIFDAFLLTSKMEGTPISILEAMSCCLPIYSTGVGQIANNFADLHNFYILNGLLENDREIINNQRNMPNYCQNLREYIVANHNIEKISNKFFEKIFSNALSFKEKSRKANIIVGEYI